MAEPNVRVAFFPNHWRANPYHDLLERFLEPCGVLVAKDTPRSPHLSWLREHQGLIGVLHFHWPESIYAWSTPTAAYRAVAMLMVQLAAAHWLGFRVVWTMHNDRSHNLRYPLLDQIVWYRLAQESDEIIVHCRAAADILSNRLRRKQDVHVIQHGNYIGISGPCLRRDEARATLELDNNLRILLFLGSVKPYKGLEQLIQTFSEMENKCSRLIIAGRPETPDYGHHILALTTKDNRIACHLRHLPDHEVSLLLAACDAVVLPFTRILTSGSLILAMSYGRPVIAPHLGCVPEYIDATNGISYDPTTADGLSQALKRGLSVDLDMLGKRALAQARNWTWSSVAEQSAAIYRGQSVPIRSGKDNP